MEVAGSCCPGSRTKMKRLSLIANSLAYLFITVQASELSCEDLREDCFDRVELGQCESERIFMGIYCASSCGICSAVSLDHPVSISFGFQKKVLVEARFEDVSGSQLGVPQILPDSSEDSEFHQTVSEVIDQAVAYVESTVMLQPRYRSVRNSCKTYDPSCAIWAAQGDCENEPDFMDDECAPVCSTCENLHVEAKCPFGPNIDNAWRPGDLDTMFEELVTASEFQKFEPVVLSRPEYAVGKNETVADYQIGPWVVTLDNFLTVDETSRLTELGGIVGYERSTDVGPKDEEGYHTAVTSKSRTSKNAWCSGACEADPVVERVVKRMESITGIPATNGEHIQLLRYEPGQFYKVHHDYIQGDETTLEGSRILTVFLYLNDVKEGGATNFPDLGIAVEPKNGRALLWPSVLNDQPHEQDWRLRHEAQTVVRGIKFGANVWFHQRDYKGPHDRGC